MRHNLHRFAKRDSNHSQIADLYTALGCSVLDLSAVGWGCPDILVSLIAPKGKHCELVEVKSETGTATPAQARFHRDWKGPIGIVRDSSDVIAHVKRMRRSA